MKKTFLTNVFLLGSLFLLPNFSNAQQFNPAGDTGISMGLLPVYEITHSADCPQVQAAPSIQWFEYYYRQCDSDQFTHYKKLSDTTEHRLNQKLRELCMNNQVQGNGCTVELKVVDQHDYSRPIYNDMDESEF
jgi:hypothetical protein